MPLLTHQYFLISLLPMTSAAHASASLTHRARVFHALSDETRLAIVELLRGGERCVCDLQDALDAAQSRLSFHLKVLREAGLVRDRKEGRWSYYTLDAAGLKGAAATALGFTPSAALGTTGVGPTLQQLTPRSTQSDRVTIPAEVEADGSVDVEAPHGCCS